MTRIIAWFKRIFSRTVWVGDADWQNNWHDSNLSEKESMLALLRMQPPEWKPECSKVEYYIKKQHPSYLAKASRAETIQTMRERGEKPEVGGPWFESEYSKR